MAFFHSLNNEEDFGVRVCMAALVAGSKWSAGCVDRRQGYSNRHSVERKPKQEHRNEKFPTCWETEWSDWMMLKVC